MALSAAKSDKPDIVMVDDKDDFPTNHDMEKTAQVRTIDSIPVLGLSEEDAAFYNSITQKQRKQIIRKVRECSGRNAQLIRLNAYLSFYCRSIYD
jgi:hypothetical protein